MTAQEMAEIIIETVRKRPYASHTDLIRACGPDAEGDVALGHADFPNIFYLGGASDLFCEAYHLATPKLEPHAASWLVYLADGGLLNMPLATPGGLKRGGYKTPHWLPLTWTLKPVAAETFESRAAQKEKVA